MRKKMMRRTAALSTLIAISLSGTVMASELTINYDNGTYTATGTGITANVVTDGSQLHSDLAAVGWSDAYLSQPALTNANSYYDSTSNQITINGGTDYTQIIGDKSIEGDSSNNTVTISDAFVSSKIYTATTTSKNLNGNANNNELNVINTTVDGNAAAGGYSGITAAMVSAGGNASGNIINISENSVVRQAVWGASVGTGDAVSNKVTVDSSTVEGWISAGHSAYGDAHKNTLIISGSTTETGQVHGGRAQANGSANENSVTVSGGTVNGLIWGGAAVDTLDAGTTRTDVEASKNTVTISGGTVNDYVAAGYSLIGKTNENTVNITGGTIEGKVYGGYGVTEANDNTVNITGGTVGGRVYGGYSNIDAIGNIVSVSNASAAGVYGGVAQKGEDVTGNAKSNQVTVENAAITGNIYGGAVESDNDTDGDALNNTVTVANSTVSGHIHGGSNATDGNSEGNQVTITDTTVNGWVSGGHSSYGDANNNEITLSGAATAEVFGGRAQADGSANNNKVTINDSTVSSNVYGGSSIDTYLSAWSTVDKAEANNNEVTINGGSIAGTVYGGYNARNSDAYENSANSNTVNIAGGTIGSEVYGGYTKYGTANDNTVNITGGTTKDNIYGGYGVTGANENTVNITGGTFANDKRIYGGYAPTGEAHDNTVTIKDVTVAKVYGGWSDGDATGNTINIENTNIVSSAVAATCTAGDSQNGNATDNTINITSSTITYACGGSARGTVGDGKNNTVNITDSTVKVAVWGTSVDGTGDAVGNTVTLDNVTFENGAYVTGGHSELGNATSNVLTIGGDNTVMNGLIFGGRAQDSGGAANDNTVTITGGTFNGTGIYGGQAAETKEDNTGTLTGDANGNTVSISNANVNSIVYGGASLLAGSANENTVTITDSTINNAVYGGYGKTGANDNTVNISGTADLTNASLYGSNHADSTGNTLNVNGGWTGTTANIGNFNTINIEEAEWGTAAVNVSGTLTLNDTTVTTAAVHAAGDDESTTATLISAGSITGDVAADSSATVYKGVASIYEADLIKDGTNIIMQIPSSSTPTINQQVLAIGESRAAATAFVNQGSELIEIGLDTLARDKSEDETKVFAAAYGNWSRFSTGSHIKVDGWSGIVGAARTTDNGLTIGAFFENGIGDYRTYNNLDGYTMRGYGEAVYNGGGLLIRKDNASGTYAEASLRAGNLSNELEGAVRGSNGLAGYDIDTLYYGAHVGIGKIIPKGKDSLDVYGKFLYTHHDSENFTIDGDNFRFDSMDSQRLRLGLRYNAAQNDKVNMYCGAAYEYEFNGDADYSVIGYDLSAPSLQGSTIIGELGMFCNVNDRWGIDLNLRGYGGQREGVSGSVQVNCRF